MKLTIELKDEIRKLLKKDDCGTVAKIYGVNKSTISRYAKKHNLKLLLKSSERKNCPGEKLVKYFEKHGLKNTVEKFKKEEKKVMQCVYNWRFKNKGNV